MSQSHRPIRQAAVIGSGVMGAAIAGHLANAGIRVTLLDIAPDRLTAEEEKAGLTLDRPEVRRRLAAAAIARFKSSKPAPLYDPSFASRLTPGCLADDAHKLREAEWIVEAVTERPDVKKAVLDLVEQHRAPGSIVSTNTSGLSVAALAEGRSEDFRKHFLAAHFFNPPRYMKLVELVTSPDTDDAALSRLSEVCERQLGKGVVVAKDTPNFIANRIGTYGMLVTLEEMARFGLTVEEVDALTGPSLGRPKTATFRMLDLVGLDTLLHVVDNVRERSDDPEDASVFARPAILERLVSEGRLGEKSGQGFYRKRKPAGGGPGRSEIEALSLVTNDYAPVAKVSSPIIDGAKAAKGAAAKAQALLAGVWQAPLPPGGAQAAQAAPRAGTSAGGGGSASLHAAGAPAPAAPASAHSDAAGAGAGAAPPRADATASAASAASPAGAAALAPHASAAAPTSEPAAASPAAANARHALPRDVRYTLFSWYALKRTLLYAARQVGVIADTIVDIDRAMEWGFNWELGPFALWDALGVERTVRRMKAEGDAIPEWVESWLAAGNKTFYKQEGLSRLYVSSGAFRTVEEPADTILLQPLKAAGRIIMGNAGASLIDIGDDVACLEFHSPNNAIGSDILTAIRRSAEEVGRNWRGLVVANEGRNFCVGANLLLLLMEAQNDEWDEVEDIIRQFQDSMLQLKRVERPVVAAPHRMTLGGGVEACLPADRVLFSPETYYGLVETGVGLIPAGGGCKEAALMAAVRAQSVAHGSLNDQLVPLFETIAMAKTTTSGHEAAAIGLMRPQDAVIGRQDARIAEAKRAVLELDRAGYAAPDPQQRVAVAGREGKAVLLLAVDAMRRGGFISAHDARIATQLAHVLAGGDAAPGAEVSEQYLLDLEREAFLTLLGEPLTQQRMRHMLETGKPLRN
ncbi:3-hydroxyacyl-CoA dehydrogenase NAD-binding [Paenibacillus curdlanolyticus YK9]|uniref:3-hydroxyacyl-CoA dehydrogenase NAD-binding n=1 Tax=Paenibacillus curdlanolyticus YK9 TaxID=717606 RepID=E0IB41_9BACL|nr:3-hydroxyacyl-CoA dehydrogenase/enoyl-CoA hydratase family protein [Paenibacillus curdlanolyticus]EFM10332.1 3-hydroxyacyl-CoA dehydrogenase NAD-binding [Paenibacillus curdlanolyticus YK9]